jgi:hypothetical protein
MSMNIVGEFFSDVGKFFVKIVTPNADYEDNHNLRKVSMGVGIVGIIASIALKVFGEASAIPAVLAGFSISLVVGGVTAIPIFSILPVAAFIGTALAMTDYSHVVFVYNLNPRW